MAKRQQREGREETKSVVNTLSGVYLTVPEKRTKTLQEWILK